jgi:hypothetical protein
LNSLVLARWRDRANGVKDPRDSRRRASVAVNGLFSGRIFFAVRWKRMLCSDLVPQRYDNPRSERRDESDYETPLKAFQMLESGTTLSNEENRTRENTITKSIEKYASYDQKSDAAINNKLGECGFTGIMIFRFVDWNPFKGNDGNQTEPKDKVREERDRNEIYTVH